MTTTITIQTQHGPLIVERAALQGGMKLADGRTLLLMNGRQIRTSTPIGDIWPGVELAAAPSAPAGPRDKEAASAVAAAVEARKQRDIEAELQRAKEARAKAALEEGQSAAREAAARAIEDAAKQAASDGAPAPVDQLRPKTAKAPGAAKRAPAKRPKGKR